ncbi:MAG: hypothetical protein AAGF12_13810, partial [Myxococcota bacterium]
KIDGSATAQIAIPEAARPGTAELFLTLSPGVLASIEPGLDSLKRYPHGCLEQTTSGLIPMVLLEDLLNGSGGDSLRTEEHRSRMQAAIAHVLRHQNGDGGFGLWPTSNSEGFLTAYGLWGLMIARDQGYSIPEGRLRDAMRYLQRNARHGDDMHGQFSSQETAPFAAYVLAQAERDDQGLATNLAGEAQTLSRFSLGLLAHALEGGTASNEPLFQALSQAQVQRAGGTLIDEANEGGVMRYGTDLRATASAVQALVAADRLDEAERLVAGILGQRNTGGSWGTTYNNLWALIALHSYTQAAERNEGPTRVTVEIAGQTLGTYSVGGDQRMVQLTLGADRLPAPGSSVALTFRTTGRQEARYSARLRYALPAEAQAPASEGFHVRRELFDAESGAAVETPEVGQLLRVRLTVRTDTSLQQVALVDRIPAGFEPIDTRLATVASSQRTRRSYHWSWQEIHDERVSFFANHLRQGTHQAEYLVRANRSGRFTRPAATAEAMYDPTIWGRGAIEEIEVRR